MIVFDHVHIVMIDRIGGVGGEVFRLMERHETVDTDHKVIAPADESQIVGNGEDRHSFAETLQSPVELFFGAGVDIGSGFIQQQQFGFPRKGAGDEDTLTLTA